MIQYQWSNLLLQQKAPKISGTTVRNAPSTPAGSDPAASRPAAPGITKEEQESTRTEIGSEEDRRFLLNFLSGDYCLQGVSLSDITIIYW